MLYNLWAFFFRAAGTHNTHSHDDDEREQWKSHMDDAASSRTSVRKRLELAEAGLWGKLVAEFYVDVQAAQAERARRAAEGEHTASSPEHEWRSKAEQVIINTLDGNVK